MAIHFKKSDVTGEYIPTLYPVHTDYEDMSIPEGIRTDFYRLKSNIEIKYDKEYLKVCAFYNKLFPSLKAFDWSRSTYNTVPFTVQNQERTDTGTGITANHLKVVTDMVVSRLGNTKFDYDITCFQPTLLYAIYKDELLRVFKAQIQKFELTKMVRQCFHDAAITAFSHIFADPWTHELRKINDWEFSAYESEFNNNKLTRVLIRDYAFPTAAFAPYTKGFDEDTIKEWAKRPQIDLCLYLDCFRKKAYACVDGKCGEPIDYPFDEVKISTYSWDLGIKRSLVASLFDGLYPMQRSLDKLLAKKTQLLNNYKGPVPVFNQNCDVIIKQLSNGSGEALFLDTSLNPADLMTVLEPTPLDPNLNAEAEALKAQMYELAGIQQVSMDIENYRSAAAVVALDQQRDSAFQSQVSMLAEFVHDTLIMWIEFCAGLGIQMDAQLMDIDWSDIEKLLNECFLDVKPIQKLKQEGDDSGPDPDYMLIHVDRFIMNILRNGVGLEKMDFSLDYDMVKSMAALKLLRLKALGSQYDISAYEANLTLFLIQCFVEDIRRGEVSLNG